MIVFLSSIYMYKFYNLEIGFSKVLIELGIIIILYKGLDYLINSNQIMNRIFNIIVGLPLSEYIRKRRLTKARYVLARENCN